MWPKKKKTAVQAAETGYPSQEGNGMPKVAKLANLAKKTKGMVKSGKLR